MIDPFVLLTPILLLAVLALLGFVGCSLLGLDIPPPPGPVISGAAGDGKAFLSWVPYTSAHFNGGYSVKRGTATGGPYSLVTKLPVGTGAYTDGLLTNGAAYYYVVTQDTTYGETRNSNEVSVIPAPITFRQLAESPEAVSGNTVSTPAFNVTPGDLMVVWIWYTSTAQSVSRVFDSADPTRDYIRAVGPTPGGAGTGQQEIWFMNNVLGGSSVVVTANFSGSLNANAVISAHEYANADPNAPLDVTSAATGATANASSGSATISTTELVFGAALFANRGSSGPLPFTQHSTQAGNVSEDERVATQNPISVSATFTNGPQNWIAQMATFK